MDAITVGKRIAEYRKARGLTQRELAERLHITDGAVSKWERGINFPDLALLEPLAGALNIDVIILLALEEASGQEIASAVTDISLEEKKKLIKEFRQRAVLNILIGLILIGCLVTASLIFKKYEIYGLAHGITMGAIGFVSTMIGSELFLLRNLKRIT